MIKANSAYPVYIYSSLKQLLVIYLIFVSSACLAIETFTLSLQDLADTWSLSLAYCTVPLLQPQNNNKPLNPNYITGFIDAEGSFIIRFISSKESQTGWRVQATFEICLHSKDLPLLYSIQSFFGIGGIKISQTRDVVAYTVTGLQALTDVIIPHFLKYPLRSAKLVDFNLWVKCIGLISTKKHLNESGLSEILSIKSVLNKGLSDKIILNFPNIKLTVSPEYVVDVNPIDPYWVSGFSDGDSCFHVNISTSTNQVKISHEIGLHIREISLLNKIQEFYGGVGKVYSAPDRNSAKFIVTKSNDLVNTLLPQFDTYALQGNKLKHYLIWKEIVLRVSSKAHLNPEGFKKVVILKENLNK